MCLVCKICGYKQYNDECVEEFKKRFPNTETSRIPYYCGACQDTATDKEYKEMQKRMRGVTI